VLDVEDIPLWLEFRRRVGNSSRLFSTAVPPSNLPEKKRRFTGTIPFRLEKGTPSHSTTCLRAWARNGETS
jgi:hypothetical protein